ncbi:MULTISPECIES: flagellar biosynthesis protein FlhF [Paenibacillus]|uniref:Flagellar biosynthesis protein FlhF n=1 Tax=Paenibacillus campinasensis TaxID=66347 RepID=A0A268ESA5_9BACL|nr:MULTISPECIES: flagellar biosynthesis protein FlhF [Paenibacillus]MUG66743.1 flagellar biosynthesis protein FlhF [Paenibacillus campinasensis]PAD75964.1 flagellar biosynthesis protein FlhF [Paenibacillus campinasensis]PAK54634.1 flagellar biosynthesis protein FlhF [Paenibacillus sp. 7541]
MRVKRYIVDTMPEAMQHIRTDLGADAVILSTKDIKVGGFLGMFSRRKIEVIAAAEQEEKKKTVSSSKPRPAASAVAGGAVPQAYKKAASLNAGQQQGGAAIATAPPEESLPKRDEEYERFASALHQAAAAQLEPDPSSVEERQRVAEEAGPSRIGKERKVPEARDDKRPSAASELSITEQNLLAELREMKEWMAKLSRQNLEAQQLPEPMQRIRDQLLKQEVSAKLAERWMDAAIDAWNASGKNLDDQQLQDIIRQQAASFLADRFGGGVRKDTRIVYIAGPTGVGKTTTIAKIAAEQLFKFHRKVGFITSDTYRISAVEQLRTYASILNVPMEVVQSPGEMQRAMQRLEDCDLILMDTAGRNYRNELLVSELQSLLSHSAQSETYLVLSLTSKSSDMIEITDHFAKYALDKVIFTKMDETGSYGSLFNVLDSYDLSLSYMTNGQNVPDDLIIPDGELLCRLLLGEMAS